MNELVTYGMALLALIVGGVSTYMLGHGKATAKAEKKASDERVAAVEAASERQTTVSKEAAHVDQNVSNASDSDVDKQLRDKWTR